MLTVNFYPELTLSSSIGRNDIHSHGGVYLGAESDWERAGYGLGGTSHAIKPAIE